MEYLLILGFIGGAVFTLIIRKLFFDNSIKDDLPYIRRRKHYNPDDGSC